MHAQISVSSLSKSKLAILSFIFLASLSYNQAGVCRKKSNTKLTLAAYYPSYNSDLLPVEKIPWEDYTHLDYFVIKSPSTPEAKLEIEDEENLKEFVKAGKAHNVTVSLTLGGWTGSVYFSSLVASDSSRKSFAQNIAKTLKKYEMNGIDLDWEYPNVPGQDVLRNEVGPHSRISAAVSVHGFMGSDGEYLKDHKPYAKLLDFITIMAYDLYGPSSTPVVGPNAPLFDTCNDPGMKYSVSQAIKTWTSTGFPASQILLGIPSYGYQYQLENSKLNVTHFSSKAGETSLFFGSIDPSKQGKGAKNGQQTPGGCGSPTDDGNFVFKDLMTCGFLSSDGTTGLKGFERHYDNCTHTPLLFNPTSKLLIAYDDQASLAEKTEFAKSKGLAGINIFDAAGDTESKLLLKSIKKALYS
ncbi:family 18 glycoside hydrolase [Melampsora americana]|nr:family 18 glycoside hydrolase [Melampsora americana]